MLDLTDGIYKDMTEKIIESNENGREIDSLDAFLMFLHAAGIVMNDRPEREETLNLFRTLAPFEGFKNYMKALALLRRIYCFRRIIAAYKGNKISPVLRKLLETAPPTWQTLPGNQDKTWNQVMFDLIQSGKADFSSFKGPDKTQENWLLSLNVMQTPFPHIETDVKTLEADLPSMKAEALKLLEDSIKQEHGQEEKINKLLDLADNQHRIQKETRSPLIRGSLMEALKEPALYLNAASGEITDLRPYVAEIKKLLSPVSWDYLKEFAAAGRKALEESKEERPRRSIFDKAFIKMFNTAPTNDIITLNTAKSGRPDSEKGIFEQNMFTKEWEYRRGGTELNLPVKTLEGNILPPAFTTSTLKTMHFLSLLFTAQNSQKGDNITPVLETTVREYMAATGRSITTNTIKETTKTLKKDLELLNEMKFRYNNKKYSLNQVRPFPGVHLNRGKIRVTLDNDFARYLAKTTGFLMNYPAALLKLKENNSNLYPLGYKLALNRSNDTNIRKGKANILSVPVCLEFCPGLPTIEKVRKSGKSPTERIIEPFEKALDALQQQGVLERWEYCLPKGEPLGQAAVTDYNYFVSLYILYEIKDFPLKNELPRIQAAAEKRQKKQERIEKYKEKNIAKQRAAEALKAQ